MACPSCKMEPIDGVTHHLSRCPMRPSPVREPTARERAYATVRSLPASVYDLYKDYEDEIFILVLILFTVALAAFFIFYPE